MAMKIERISAVTFRVSNMKASVQFYRAGEAESAILNLEQGERLNGWGRLIFHVAEVDARSGDASWGERYFHLLDPDGHELSFARPLK